MTICFHITQKICFNVINVIIYANKKAVTKIFPYNYIKFDVYLYQIFVSSLVPKFEVFISQLSSWV